MRENFLLQCPRLVRNGDAREQDEFWFSVVCSADCTQSSSGRKRQEDISRSVRRPCRLYGSHEDYTCDFIEIAQWIVLFAHDNEPHLYRLSNGSSRCRFKTAFDTARAGDEHREGQLAGYFRLQTLGFGTFVLVVALQAPNVQCSFLAWSWGLGPAP